MVRRKNSDISYFFLAVIGGIIAVVTFLWEHILIVVGLILVLLGTYLVIKMRKQREIQMVFPKQGVSDDIKQEIHTVIGFVYAEGDRPNKDIPSIIEQQDSLCKLYSYADLFKGYEPIVEKVFENAISKVNTYNEITNREEFYEQLHFAFESLCKNIILVVSDTSQARKCFGAIINSVDRLLLMNQKIFKKLLFYV